MQAVVAELKAREGAVAGNERRLDADRQALQQQRQDAELAGMKAQLAMQQATPQLPAAPRSVSRLQVCLVTACVLFGSHSQAGFLSKFGCSKEACPLERDQIAFHGDRDSTMLLNMLRNADVWSLTSAWGVTS